MKPEKLDFEAELRKVFHHYGEDGQEEAAFTLPEEEIQSLLAAHRRETEAEKIAFIEELIKTADEAEKGNDYRWSRKGYREYLEYELNELKGEPTDEKYLR